MFIALPVPTAAAEFTTIQDSFENLDDWELVNINQTYTGPDSHIWKSSNEYTATIDAQEGNPSPSALISGEGFVSRSSLTRTIHLDNLDGDLFLGVDYRAVSDIPAVWLQMHF